MTDPAKEKKETRARRVPALVVSGFLGSGKTSLVRHLLEQAQALDLRIAVISNELGELGIDRALLGGGDETYVELEGGCVCCELSDDLIETLEMLRQKVDPDRIVVETSGVALPFDTQLNFWREPVSSWIGDDMAIVVVNAEQVLEGRDLTGTFQDQVSSADLLVLNKIDLVPESILPEVEEKLRSIEAEAPLVSAIQGRLEPDLLFPPDLADVDRTQPPPAQRPHQHEHYLTRIWEVPQEYGESEIEDELKRPGLLRAKGFVVTESGVQLVQVVGRRIEFSDPDPQPRPELIGRVILIERSDLPPAAHLP